MNFSLQSYQLLVEKAEVTFIIIRLIHIMRFYRQIVALNQSIIILLPHHFSRYKGQVGANLILGGVDCTGNHLYTVGPYGSMDKNPYLAMGGYERQGRLKILYIL